MVGRPRRQGELIREVEALYAWIDAQRGRDPMRAGRCRGCGACCRFTSYDHLLFVTPPELIYLAERLGAENLASMAPGQCPYQKQTECAVYGYRFATCRIFCCGGDADFQSELSETTLKKLQRICERFEVPYRYADLATALARLSTDIDLSVGGPCPGDRAG